MSKTFGGVHALDDVSIEVRSGEIHALLGENGAGKSTILKILNGVHAPTAGRIEVYGTELTEHTPEAAKRAGIGMIFQEMSLVPTLTAAQNIFLNNEMKARSASLTTAAPSAAPANYSSRWVSTSIQRPKWALFPRASANSRRSSRRSPAMSAS